MSNSITKNSIFNSIYTVANLLFPLITSMYVSRIILANGVGKVAYVQSIVSYFVSFAALGLPIYGLREVAIQNEDSKLNKLFTELFFINAISTTIALVVYVTLLFVVDSFKINSILYLACGLLIVFNYFNVDWFYKGIEEYGYILMRSLIIKIISLAAMIIFVRNEGDFIIYAFINSIATGGNHIFNFIHLRKFAHFQFVGIKMGRHLVPVLFLAASVLLDNLYSKIDITMLGVMTSDANTGLYSYAHKTILLIITACTAITATFMSRLSYYYQNDMNKFNSTLQLGMRILTFLTLPMAVGTFLLAPKLMVLLYGIDFSFAAFTLRLFCPLLLINGFGDILCYQLVVCTGHEKMRVPAGIIGIIVNIGLNFILIPKLLQNGAAVASVISEFAVNIFLFVFIRKHIKISFEWKPILQAVAASALMTGAILLVMMIPMPDIFIALVSLIGGVLVYVAVNLLMRNQFSIAVLKKIASFGKKKAVMRDDCDEDVVITDNAVSTENAKSNGVYKEYDKTESGEREENKNE